MCGIYGYFGHGEPTKMSKMGHKLKQRGPDARGETICETLGYALGHTLLSIIDLSSSANLPMASLCGEIEIVFNGEI